MNNKAKGNMPYLKRTKNLNGETKQLSLCYDTEINIATYQDFVNALIGLWVKNIITDGEYYKIKSRLNEYYMKGL